LTAEQVIHYDGELIAITISLGVATISSDMEPLDQLLARADAALYDAKESGRNQLKIR